MDDRFKTIAGWVLFAGIVALGSSIVAGEIFHCERPEKMGYPIEGVVVEGEGGAEAEQADRILSRQRRSGRRASRCSRNAPPATTPTRAAPTQLGPNLWGVLGEPVGKGAGFAFSEALAEQGRDMELGQSERVAGNPKDFAPGTKMTFAGLSNPQDRANVIAFLNAQSDSPLPLPAAPAEAAAVPRRRPERPATARRRPSAKPLNE